ncbi:histidinol-phosphate transaminase [sulfur-oxidizing endosymbiont of Gigantopelta aegis]|uniref:histidinol-phosphate transaminase n=1 Tax=sulfur-oxidizing endosymbiont of Gigantopelta aegis TaxID=2794934 RepID=UPI0018DC4A80|nr:histidinol-phosphate transaminase [sulfur-oxidizing endosymbiont of Gigantopelta aegis]
MVKPLVKEWIRDDIRALNAYHVPDPGEMIKLDAMENPYLWPEAMQQLWLSQLANVPLNRYPDPSAAKLTAKIEQVMAVPKSMKSILGNGSDELIQIICMALAKPDSVVMAPEPTFVMYQMIAQFTNMHYQGIPLDEQFQLDMPAMREAIEKHQPAVIFLAYPNNPTGNLFSEQDVRDIIAMAPGLVVVDEAYHAFAGHSFMPMLGEYANLVVMRTVSKMGLAGLRLGLLSGRPEWLNEFDKVRLPYNINVLTQFSAEFALEHSDVLQQQTDQICADRIKLQSALNALPNITQYPSAANFILFKIADRQSDDIFTALKQSGILIKRLANPSGPLKNTLRVTIGTEQENAAFIKSLSDILKH